MKLADRIVSDADTCSGYPRVEGTRIRVSHVLGWLASGMSFEEILRDYPQLTTEDVRACQSYGATTTDVPPVAAE